MAGPTTHPGARPTAAASSLLLDILHRAREPMSVDEIARTVGWSHSEVRDELARLAEVGCRLDDHPVRGMTLRETALEAWEDLLRCKLDLPAHRVVRVYRQTASTQDAVRQLVETCGNAAADAVVIADVQTAARGRLGRRWVTRAGDGLAFSRAVALPVSHDLGSTSNHLTLAGVVAVTKAIEAVTTLCTPDLAIKWPNDVLICGRKVAGVLVEVFGNFAVIGVGINTASRPSDDLPNLSGQLPTSLLDQGARVDRVMLLAEVLTRLDEALSQQDMTRLAEDWRQRCPTGTEPTTFRAGNQTIVGRVIDLHAQEGLIVRTASGELVHLPARTTTVLEDPAVAKHRRPRDLLS